MVLEKIGHLATANISLNKNIGISSRVQCKIKVMERAVTTVVPVGWVVSLKITAKKRRTTMSPPQIARPCVQSHHNEKGSH